MQACLLFVHSPNVSDGMPIAMRGVEIGRLDTEAVAHCLGRLFRGSAYWKTKETPPKICDALIVRGKMGIEFHPVDRRYKLLA